MASTLSFRELVAVPLSEPPLRGINGRDLPSLRPVGPRMKRRTASVK